MADATRDPAGSREERGAPEPWGGLAGRYRQGAKRVMSLGAALRHRYAAWRQQRLDAEIEAQVEEDNLAARYQAEARARTDDENSIVARDTTRSSRERHSAAWAIEDDERRRRVGAIVHVTTMREIRRQSFVHLAKWAALGVGIFLLLMAVTEILLWLRVEAP